MIGEIVVSMKDVVPMAAAKPVWYKIMRQKEKGPVEAGEILLTIGWEERVISKSMN